MGWFSKRRGEHAEEPSDAAQTDHPPTPTPTPTPSSASLDKVDEVIAAAEGLPPAADSEIKRHFDYVSTTWCCEEILLLDQSAMRELLRKVVLDDAARGFHRIQLSSSTEDESPYVQLNSIDRTFRPYRIVKRHDGLLALYGHTALYQAKRALDRARGASLSTADLTNELIAIARTEEGLLPPRGSELREHIRAIGSELNECGGHELMLQTHATVRQSVGGVHARELEAAWDGIGKWRG